MAVHSNILLCLQQTLFPHRFQAQVSFTSLVFLLRGLPSSGMIRSMASVYPSETHSYSQQTTESHPASLCTYLSSDCLGFYIRPPFLHYDLLSRCVYRGSYILSVSTGPASWASLSEYTQEATSVFLQ